MSWTYEQSTGRLCNAEGQCVAIGYAGGNCGKNPEGKNNPAMQNVVCVGPLPQGIYTAGTPVKHLHLGPYAVPLIPHPGNEMHGRSAFYMHGDRIRDPGNASEGCIIMPRTTRVQYATSTDTTLHVVP